MADMELQVEIKAETAKLEAGAKRSEQTIKKTANVIETEAASMNQKFESMLATIGKVGAGLFLAEAAFKGAASAVNLFAGDTEAAAAALKSLPILGPLITSIFDFADALENAGAEARKARLELTDFNLELLKASQEITAIERFAAMGAEIDKINGLTEAQILFNKNRLLQNVLDEKLLLTQKKINEEFDAQLAKAKEQGTLSRQFELQVKVAREDALATAENLMIREKRLLFLQVQQAREKEAAAAAAEEEAKATERAEETLERMVEARKELDRIAEEDRKRAIEHEERMKKEREEQYKAEQEMIETRKKAEEELTDARQKAEMAVAGATASFATAGGSFTSAVSAQVNEAKLLRSISEQSRDFLSQIVVNTARMGVGFA